MSVALVRDDAHWPLPDGGSGRLTHWREDEPGGSYDLVVVSGVDPETSLRVLLDAVYASVDDSSVEVIVRTTDDQWGELLDLPGSPTQWFDADPQETADGLGVPVEDLT